MTTFFLFVCSVSVIFFLVFLWQCGQPRRPAKWSVPANRPAAAVSVDSPAAQRSLAHLENQMAEFLGSDGGGAMIFGLMPGSQAMKPKGQRDAGSQDCRDMVRQSSSALISRTDGEQIAW